MSFCEFPKHIEKQNHTLLMHCRRPTRLSNAFSKKLENFKAAVALNFAYYNFVERGRDTIAMLELPSVISPKTAVQAAIVSGKQK